MRVWDIVRNARAVNPAERDGAGAKTAGGDSEARTLSGSMQIMAVDPAFLDSAPAMITVYNDSRTMMGEVRREDLSFFMQRNGMWFSDEVLDSLEVGIIAVNEKGRIFYVNPAYEDLLGVPVRKVVGRNILKIEPESDLSEALRQRRDMINSSKYIKSVNRYVSLRIHTLYEGNVFRGAYSLFTDVTKLKSLHSEIERMSGMMDEFRQQLGDNYQKTDVITRNRRFLQLLDQAAIAARTDVPVLIRGENGVGKEVVARYIHKASGRGEHPMVVVNCSSIPETLIESELFGYEEGSFTGAKKGGRMGKFELADHGTIFLDEIGDMPVALQSRLLRVIQNGEIEKIGRQRTIPVDVRIIAATNQPLEDMIREKRFRKDLFFRLNVISLKIPALRDRKEDIPLLADHFLKEYCSKYERKKSISQEGYLQLLSHEWSGNVRELQNCIERAVILSEGETLDFGDLVILGEENAESAELAAGVPGIEKEQSAGIGDPDLSGEDEAVPLEKAMAAYEEAWIRRILQEVQGNRNEAIRRLGLTRRTFYRKCAAYGILRD